MYHHTDDGGFKAIASQVEWRFKVAQPPGSFPKGAYFTTLPPHTVDLCTKLLIPKRKTEFLFEFSGDDGLRRLDDGKGRGRYVFYSAADYIVARQRQQYKGKSEAYSMESE